MSLSSVGRDIPSSCANSVLFNSRCRYLLYSKSNLSDVNGLRPLYLPFRFAMKDVKGEFVKDSFMKDTYFQIRDLDGTNIYYIIYRWWDKLANGKVKFEDVVNGEGTVFIARN